MDDWLKVLSESESKGEMRPETLRPAIGLEKRQGAAQDAAGEPAQAHTYLRGLSLPKGIQPATLKIIWESVENSDTPVSVSYTHLDVYKRQALAYERALPGHFVQERNDIFRPRSPETAGISLLQHSCTGRTFDSWPFLSLIHILLNKGL